MSEQKTDRMRCDVLMYRLAQVAVEHRMNAQGLGARSREKHEYTASVIESFLKLVKIELAQTRWIEVKD